MMLIMLASLLAACGSTVTTFPTPSAETPGSQTYTVVDALNGTLSFTAPAGLRSHGDTEAGLLTVGTSDAALSTSAPTALPAGQWGLAVGALPKSVAQTLIPKGQTVTPQIILDSLKVQMMKSVPQVTFTPSTALTIGGHEGARLSGTSPQGDVVLLAVTLDNSFLIGTGVVAKGEMPTREPLLTEIMASATYTSGNK